MNILNYFSTLVMFLLGAIVSSIVVAVAQFFGVSGWIAGPIFAALVLAFIYADDLIMGFVMKHLISLFAKFEETNITDSDKKQIEENYTRSSDYYGFLAGTVVGILAILLGVPSLVLDWVQL